jgi:LCP family protein required for cell wall assembly
MNNIINKFSNRLFIISFIVLVQAAGLVFAYKTNFLDQQLKQKQINGLITEIGQLKEENQNLLEKIDSQRLGTEISANIFENNAPDWQKEKVEVKTVEQPTQDLENIQKIQELENHNNQLNIQNQQISDELSAKSLQITELQTAKQIKDSFLELNDKLFVTLLLGENAKLTDTIIVCVIYPEKQKMFLISIPRDLTYQGRKINEYYEYYGNDKLNEITEDITGLKIDKYALIDVKLFIELIDFLGGIDLEVEKDLTDESFPGDNNSYITINFVKGWQHMDGVTAMQYARSRKSTSDFDRSYRQHKVLIAAKEKLKNSGVLNNLEFFINSVSSISKNVKTNINVLEFIAYFDQYKNYDISAGNILSDANYLYSTKNSRGQFVLLPIGGDFNKIKTNILKLF